MFERHGHNIIIAAMRCANWHGNPEKYDPEDKHFLIDKTYGELYQATLDRAKWIRDCGYNLIEIWEADWDRAIKAVIKIQRAFRTRHNIITKRKPRAKK